MGAHCRPRQLVCDAGLRLRESVRLQPLRQFLIGHLRPLQFGLQVPGGAFRPFLSVFANAMLGPVLEFERCISYPIVSY